MNNFRTRIITGHEELLVHSDLWNDLWSRSETHQPTVRAELINLWCQSFSKDSLFQAVVVETENHFVAALPLLPQRKFGILSCLEFPTNCWCNAGDLILDPNYDRNEVCHALLNGLEQLEHQFVMFDEINIESDRWISFCQVMEERGKEYRISESYTVGITHILHDWKLYQQSWSGNHRRGLKNDEKNSRAGRSHGRAN